MVIPSITRQQQDWRQPRRLSHAPTGQQHRPSPNWSSDRQSRRNKNNWRKKIFALWPVLVLLILVGGVVGLFSLAWISKDLPNPDGVINRSMTVSTKIYDRTGTTVLYDIHGDIKRTLIQLNDIPDYAQKATIAAEDHNFYKHSGFSITGIIRSLVVNITTGSRVGGSTLTQQFVKNSILTNEKTYTRKIKEALLTYQIEKKFSKDEILQMYFNEIPYGSVIYGIEAAAQTFFGKPAKDLSIAESAILAAIPQRPTYYSPYGSHLDALFNRQRYVLDSMADLGYITKEQAEAAKQEKIIFKPFSESIIAPHFVMYVRDILSEKYGEDFIKQEGLKVYTSLDLDKQRKAEQAVTDGVEKNGAKYNFTNSALIAMDPKTGQILAMVGSADYFNADIDGQVNVTLRPRQPGSSFKPIVYTASFIKGYTPDTVLYDVNTNFDTTGGAPYEPRDYDLKERGPISIRKALAGSLNIPAVKATYLTGVENILDFADSLGYTTFSDRSRFGLSIVLGGGEVKLLEHANAFATLANEGTKHDIAAILKIEDKNGKVIFEYKDKTESVLEPQIARLTSDVLSDDSARAYVFGSGSKLTLPNRPVAAKTGTTNDYHDAWTMGYTPSLVAGVWVGNNNNDAMKKGADGSIVAAPIWNQFMVEALKDSPVEQFTKPDRVVTGKAVLDGENIGLGKVKIDTMSGKLATEYTPESTTKEVSVNQPHCILYYVNKDDPRGDQPRDPSDDPQFRLWEEAVLSWAGKNGFTASSGDIPTEYDDIHKAEDQPKLTIITPLPNQTIKDTQLNIEVAASAKRGLKTVAYYLDDQLITNKSDDSDTVIDLSQADNGYHKITVIAKDDLQNTTKKSVEINLLLANPNNPIFNWVSPANNTSVTIPTNLKATLTNWQRISKIDFYYKSTTSSVEQYISFINPKSGDITLNWKNNPGTGDYIIYGNMFDQSNKKYKTAELKIKVK